MKELEIAKLAARAAGDILRGHFASGVAIESKGHKDIVTVADKEAQTKIIEILTAEFPDDTFFAEESDKNAYSEGRMWVIDPLDGTINFARGIPLFGVSIAFVEGGDRKCGVIYLPYFDELYYAQKGGGSFCNDAPITVSSTKEAAAALISLDNFNIGPPAIMGNLNLLKRELIHRVASESLRIRNFGASSVELAFVASGKLDAYIVLFTHFWDIAAGSLIVEEAGGMATDYHGNRLTFDPKCVITSNQALHATYLKILNKGNNSLQDRYELLKEL